MKGVVCIRLIHNRENRHELTAPGPEEEEPPNERKLRSESTNGGRDLSPAAEASALAPAEQVARFLERCTENHVKGRARPP